MKHRPLVLSMILSVLFATLAPLSALASAAGWFYQARCGGSTGFVTTSCLTDGITSNGVVLQASVPSYAPPETNAGVDLQLISPGLPKNGIGFQSLTVKADLGKVSECDVFAVLNFTSGPPLIVSFDDFSSSCSKGCFDSYTLYASDYPGTGSRIVSRVRFLVRGSYDYCAKTVLFGNVQLSQRQQTGLNATIWTNKTTNTCGIPLPVKGGGT